jgi:GNAT superfamily N-acetyltransferase
MADLITTRLFQSSDLNEVVEVMRLGLGESPSTERSARMFSWKHLQNPFGESLVLLAEVGGLIVGLRAFMRWNLVDPNGHLIRCMRPVDTATLPEFRRRGIFRRLTMEAVETASLEGTDLIFNTPNPTSKAGYLTMGWQEVGWVPLLLKPRLRAIRSSSAGGEDWFASAAFRAPSTLHVDRPPRGLRTPRTESYLQWRLLQHPTATYRSVSFDHSEVVVRAHRRNNRSELVVSDILGEATASNLRRTVAIAKVDYAVTSFARGSAERRAAIRAGFMPISSRSGLFLVCRPLGDIGCDPANADIWDFALSDLELL